MGWGLIWAVVAVILLLMAPGVKYIKISTRRDIRTFTIAGVATILAITFGWIVAAHFAHKVGVNSPWW
jgi:hypothetical protein